MIEKADLHLEQHVQVSRDGGENWYHAKITNIRADVVTMTTPSLKNNPLQLHRGDEIQVRFFRDDSSYYFTTRVTMAGTGEGNTCKFAYPGEINRVQQRNHVRLPVTLDVEYAPVERATGSKVSTFSKALSVDISGGGMKLAVRHWVKENSLLLVRFTVPLKDKPETLELKARVIRCINTDPQRNIFQLGLRFEHIKLREQDIIMRFIFERTTLQKRLL